MNGYEFTRTVLEAAQNESMRNANLGESLTLMWQGMLGIFIVAGVIIAMTTILNAVTKNKGSGKADKTD